MSSPSAITRFDPWHSIGRKLPLLATALLSVAVAAIAGTAYYEMRRVLLHAASEHLVNVSQQVAAAFAKSEEKLQREGSPLSHDSLVRAALRHPDPSTLAGARNHLAARSAPGQFVTSELWDSHGVRLVAAGAGLDHPSAFGHFTSAVGPLIAVHDTVFTQVQVPILGAKSDTLGFVREVSRVSSAQTKQLLAGLIGKQAVLLVGNVAGDVWTDLDRRVDGPGVVPKNGVAVSVSSHGRRWVGVISSVSGVPWRVWVARPESEVLDQANAFLLRMLLVAIVAIGFGFIGARLLSRHVVGPLGELTRAAERIAGGDYATRANVTLKDEVGRLALAFNTMASAIETAHAELAEQQVELEAQQTELQSANEELRQTVTAVTEARESEERSHALAEAIVTGAIDAVITINQDEHIIEFNPAAERTFGYSASEAKAMAIRDLVKRPPANGTDKPGQGTALSLLSNGANTSRHVELIATRANGEEFFVELATTRIPVAGPPTYTLFVRDLSERKQFEAQLQQAQKMEAVGRLAGGVAHDFNNMLTVIVSYTDLMLADATIPNPVRQDLTQVRSAADRAAVLTRQLLAFSRKQVLHPSVLDLNTVVGGVTTMLARVMPENIRLSSTLGASLNPVFVDRGQLEQVIMNLAVNARDAMPSGGALVIETSNAMLDETYLAMHAGGTTGAHVVLSVRDTGIGMDAETRDRIFEPFFTTKPVGQGTGLGLATVYGIVRQSGGSIYVYSEPGHGTTFKVYFPAHLDAENRIDASADPVLTSAPAMTVLLVEDDPAVRDATQAVLRRLGHDAVPAPDVTTALGLVRGGVDLFDVVLTDAVMPGQSGLELAEILRGERPDLPVILMSGYAEETINYDESGMQGVVFIEKPFTAPTLARALADASARMSPAH